MSIPRLPAVQRLADTLAGSILSSSPAPSSAWHVQGPATAGKSALLHELASRLRDKKCLPIVVAPPSGSLDAGPAALVAIAGALNSAGMINGEIAQIQKPEVPWPEKLSAVRRWLTGPGREAVLLCDEPSTWPASSQEDFLFAGRTQGVVTMLVSDVPCRRVITGRIPGGLSFQPMERLEPASDSAAWLSDEREWGLLADAAKELLSLCGDRLNHSSPLEIRLLVALGFLSTPEAAAQKLSSNETRRDISRTVAWLISEKADQKPLCEIWGKLSLVRRPFTEDVLSVVGADRLSGAADVVLKHSLLYTENDRFVLHDTLKAHARAQRWIDDATVRSVHRNLAQHFAQQVRRAIESGAPAGDVLLDSLESHHHAAACGDTGLLLELKPFFVEQLDALGRTLSKDLKRYDEAVKVFQQVIQWDPDDDYAHHYYAFNLDVQGVHAEEVDAHYRKAVELMPNITWWHSRHINFLITRGRLQEARKAWDEALDVFRLPDVEADPLVYENLHLWVARILLHRGELTFAEKVLRDIPNSVKEQNPSLLAMANRLDALLEAQKNGAYVPGPFLREGWWKEGPFLLRPKMQDEKKLVKWLAGRIDAIDEEGLHLRVAIIQSGKSKEPEFGRLVVTIADFENWSGIKARHVDAGRFLEIGVYAKPGSKPASRPLQQAQVHKIDRWGTDLPRLFPDPARYLKSGFPR